MSRHITATMFLLASVTIAVGAHAATDARRTTNTADAKRVANATNATDAQSTTNAANTANASDAQSATNASGATNASDARAAVTTSEATKASDAQRASDARDASSKSDAAAKRQAKATSKAGDDATNAAEAKDEVKTLSGISILGNQEAPKSLVIVPWKSSEIGEMPGLSRLLDDSVQPIDKEVFMRELDYYEIRSSSR